MNAVTTSPYIPALSLVILVATGASQVLGDDQSSPATVSVADIGTKVTLVGRLGQPLGTMMTVRGTWRLPHRLVKDYSLRFTVSHVNEKRLAEPVEFHISQVEAVAANRKSAIPDRREEQEALDGVSWTLRAYETGRVNKVPDEYWRELGWGPPAMADFGTFTSEIVGILQTK